MEELQKAAIANGIQDGPQVSRFILWVGNECFEGREVPDLMVLTARAKQLVKMFLAQDQQIHPPSPERGVTVLPEPTVKTVKKLDRPTLSAIYEILIRCCGASEYDQDRTMFVEYVLGWDPSRALEWRFQGWLGFGGKVWLYNSDVPYVTCYPEDSNASREKSGKKANAELAELFSHGNK